MTETEELLPNMQEEQNDYDAHEIAVKAYLCSESEAKDHEGVGFSLPKQRRKNKRNDFESRSGGDPLEAKKKKVAVAITVASRKSERNSTTWLWLYTDSDLKVYAMMSLLTYGEVTY